MVGASKTAWKTGWMMTVACFVAGVALLSQIAMGAPAEDKDKATAEETLKGKGLVKSGALYLLEGDAKLQESLKDFRAVKKQFDDDTRKRNEIEKQIRMAKGMIGQWELDYRNLNEKLSGAKDAFQNNQIVG